MSATFWSVTDDDGAARAAAFAMLVNALSAATTSCGGFETGDIFVRIAGRAFASCKGARKAGPPVGSC